MRPLLLLFALLASLRGYGQRTDTLGSGLVRLPGVQVAAHQQLLVLSSKGQRYTGGLAMEPGRQAAIFFANPDSLQSHEVRGISVLLERRFSYGRLQLTLRQPRQGTPTGPDLLPAPYYVLPGQVPGHHTWVSFVLPEGVPLPAAGIFVVLEGVTTAPEEQYLGLRMQVLKAVVRDGSSRARPLLRIQGPTGPEQEVPLDECPRLVTSPVADGQDANTWVKIAPGARYPFRRNLPGAVGSRKPTAYNYATQLTLLSW